MLKNFWWPLEFGADVTRQPKRLKALGQDFVLYRTSDGQARVMSDLCIHRGGALSGGWVEGNCIVCPYHGWQYDEKGECVKIPANLPGTPISRKARVDAYPVQEKYGVIWAFLGDLPEAERPPLPELPHVNDPNLKRLDGSYPWKVNYVRAVENSIDASHAPWVHGGAFGNRDEPEVPDFKVVEEEWGAGMDVTLKPPPAKGLWSRIYTSKKPQGVRTRASYLMPCITVLEVTLPLGLMVLINLHIPIDQFHTVTRWINMRSFFKGNWADGDARKRVIKIFEQDKIVLEQVRPELVPFDIGAELHVPSDAVQIHYRRLRQKLLAKGWGIDMHKIESELDHRQFTVIPSPARREVPELARAWVMKEVPVTKVSEDQ